MAKTDRRILKTKESIRNAFMQLVHKKDFQAITITELAELANIDRKTFYLHYTSIHDILKEFEAELADKVILLLRNTQTFEMDAFFYGLTDIMLEHIDFYRHISRDTSYSFLMSECKNILKDALKHSFYESSALPIEKFNVYSEYVSSGIIGIYTDWLNNNSKMELDELTSLAKEALTGSWSIITKKN
ncbi:TetR/AcrR family transcriptional regulator [Konateibacter massiliensis]|uniref:TetR/AcrR family transcriptional regulator n=1 Tax=Konateibacter massiliensis TaxID=2002841 RepID=UPI000C149601|nr:TetR-like C-terminal domain-containing protein [Konateibacter massiliensis]